MIQAVLFDLDGTFADTAPDLAHAVNLMRASRGMSPVPVEKTRPVTSMGARGLLGAGFGITPAHPEFAGMREEFLDLYAKNLCLHTRLFPGMAELVDVLDARAIKWGIVTNKAERFAIPLIDLLGYARRCACVIGGDTTGRLKPHPDSLFAATTKINVPASDCLYAGDDERDIQAGRAAGMHTVAVRYGYLNGSDPASWGAHAVVDTPIDMLGCLGTPQSGR